MSSAHRGLYWGNNNDKEFHLFWSSLQYCPFHLEPFAYSFWFLSALRI